MNIRAPHDKYSVGGLRSRSRQQWHLADAHIIKIKFGRAGAVAVHAAAVQQKHCPVAKRKRSGRFLLTKGAMKQ
jgi:hypothetical protein